jgi:hypothetical protein
VSASDTKPESGARRTRIILVVAVALAVALGLAVAVPLLATSTPQFFERYHLLERRYVNLEDSLHEGIGCRDCHETEPLANGVELIGDFYTSLVTTSTTPAYFTFKPPRPEACLKCHEDDWSSSAERNDRIPHPAHARVSGETRDCVFCHKWTAHLETYAEEHKEMPFSGVCVVYGCHVGTKQPEQCFDCHHVLHESGDEWKEAHPSVVRTSGQNSCLENCHEVEQCQQCHTTGERPEFSGLPIEVGFESIEELHVKTDWIENYHGDEALKDPAKCEHCHKSTGECDECHTQRPAFHGSTKTWIGRHKDESTAVDDPRCLTCHEEPWCEDCHRQFEEMG